MDSCCQDKACELEALRVRQSRTLWIVLGINGGMFGLELILGLLAGSTALLADSLDMLGDALVYGFSLYVVGRSTRWRAGAALMKGVIMAGFGLMVLSQAGSYPSLFNTSQAPGPHSISVALLCLEKKQSIGLRS